MRAPGVPRYSAGAAFLGDDVDPEAITEEDSLVAGGDHGDSNSVDCMHGSYSSSLSLHGVRVDDEHSALENSSRPSSPFDILTPQDVVPIEMARSRFLDIIVDNFIGENVIEVAEPSGLDCLQANDKLNKRKQQEVRYEGDPGFALPLMYIANLYETLVSDVNARLASLIGSREKTIGVALEAAGGLYRKLTQKFPKKGSCSFRRRALATSHATRTRFPELVVQGEKRVRFVVINGLVILERPKNVRMEDAEWGNGARSVAADLLSQVVVAIRSNVLPAGSFQLERLDVDSMSAVLVAPICSLLAATLKELRFYYDFRVEGLTEEEEKALQLLTSLQELYFIECPGLPSLPQGLHTLPSLTRLEVWFCPEIRSLPKGASPLHCET